MGSTEQDVVWLMPLTKEALEKIIIRQTSDGFRTLDCPGKGYCDAGVSSRRLGNGPGVNF
ncbi:hypothetical protein ASF53_05225 [Methylobacterium sp. Leaf123]|nr:hypothetical protein ASF53_05225 [Methylobacterium sp. Leaf123]